jgi:hypothetical protein
MLSLFSLVNAVLMTSNRLERRRKLRKKKAPIIFQIKITRVQTRAEILIRMKSGGLADHRMNARTEAIIQPRGPTYLPDILNPARPINTTSRGRSAPNSRSSSAIA